MQHRVLYNEGSQTIWFAPRDRHGRPSVATSPLYTIVDLRYADEDATNRTVQAQVAATVGSETETTSAAAGAGESDAQLIDVTDSSDFTEGREYLIQAADGRRESFILWRNDTSNDRLYAREELIDSYPSGSTVRAFELQATFPSAEAADETNVESGGGPYQVVWEYAINGEKYLTPEIIWLSRYSVAPMISATEVLMAEPSISRRLIDGSASIHSAIAVATQDFIGELEAVVKDPAYYRTSNAGRLAVRFRALEYMHRWMPATRDSDMADKYEERYRRQVDNIINGIPPHGTVSVDKAHDTAYPGTNLDYTHSFIRRS